MSLLSLPAIDHLLAIWGKLFCFSRLWQKIAPYLIGWLFLGFHMFSKLHSRTDTFQKLMKGSFKKNHVTKELYPKKPLHLVRCVPIATFFSRKGEIGTLFPVVNLEYIETYYLKYSLYFILHYHSYLVISLLEPSIKWIWHTDKLLSTQIFTTVQKQSKQMKNLVSNNRTMAKTLQDNCLIKY